MKYRYRFYSGMTLVELISAVVISLIIVLASGVLIMSGNRSWNKTYDSAHERIQTDAQNVMLTFGSLGRKSNRSNYIVYNQNGDSLVPAVPQTSEPEEVVSGDAVEFRYWDVGLDTDDSQDLLDTSKTATAYALFYVDDGQLKVDYGSYPPGAAPAGGGSRNTSNISTAVLAENVILDPNTGVFSHTTLNGVGQGCIRIKIGLTDPNNQNNIDIITSVMLRNIWPK